MFNPLSSDGPDYWALFQNGRLNPNISEHLDIIKRYLRSMEGTDHYDRILREYEQKWKWTFDEKAQKEEVGPKSVSRLGERSLSEAMAQTSDPSLSAPKSSPEITVEERKQKEAVRKSTRKPRKSSSKK